MRMYPREFPSGRRRQPKRQAERRVYEALAGINRQGFVYYEWRKGYECIELDFAVWVEDLGRFALQVKGGRYGLVDGEWSLKTRDGLHSISTCPPDEAKLAALDLHDDIAERACVSYNPYVIPVLSLPDMEPDAAIEDLARRNGVYVIWGVGNMLDDLERIAGSRSVSGSLTMERIAAEVLTITDGQIRLAALVEEETDQRTAGPSVLSLSVAGRNIVQVSAKEMRLRVGACRGSGGQP